MKFNNTLCPVLHDEEANPDHDLWNHYDELRRWLERASSFETNDGFERVMSELAERSRRDLLDELNAVIAASFLGGKGCAFAEGPDRFDRLFMSPRLRLRAIVTPNYDILAEEALGRRLVSYRYGGVPSHMTRDGVSIYKIHGSVNFVLPKGSGRGVTPEMAERNTKGLRAAERSPFHSLYNDHPLYAIDIDKGRRNALLHFNRHSRGRYYNVLATYGPEKPVVYGLQQIKRIRECCVSDLTSSHPARIVAVGIRPPFEGDARTTDDPTWSSLCQLFKELRSNKEYWSRCPREGEEMARFGFVRRDGWFCELVDHFERGR
jgi:hypothetical protein